MRYLRVFLCDSCEWRNSWSHAYEASSCGGSASSCYALRCCAMATLDEAEDVGLGDTAVLACAWHRVNIDSFLLGEMSNSWSRQGFTTRLSISSLELITWRCCCGLVFDLILCGYNVLGWLRGLH